MIFDKDLHTKQYLLDNLNDLYELASSSKEFAQSALASDFDLLSLRVEEPPSSFSYCTIAHILAAKNSGWSLNDATQNMEVLKLRRDRDQACVAHLLAIHQNKWCTSEITQNIDLLTLRDKDGRLVAHELAEDGFHEWGSTPASLSKQILLLSDEHGNSVIEILAGYNESWAKKIIGNKELLTIPLRHKSLVEYMCLDRQLFPFIESIAETAELVIKFGVAYQHSELIKPNEAKEIIEKTELITLDNFEPEVSLKQWLAAYSTLSHAKANIPREDSNTIQAYEQLISEVEQSIVQLFEGNPLFYEMEHSIDIGCDPGAELIGKLKSCKIISDIDTTTLDCEADTQRNLDIMY